MSEFNEMIAAEIPSLRRYARALARSNTFAADDLVQSCLLRAIDRQHLFQPGTNIRAWLFTLLHNQYVNTIRRSVREGKAVELKEVDNIGRNSNAMPSLELRDLRAAIHKLPDEQRIVLLLIGLEGFTYEDAANVLSVPVGTIRSRLSRARDGLRILMGIVESGDDILDGHCGSRRGRRATASHSASITAGRSICL